MTRRYLVSTVLLACCMVFGVSSAHAQWVKDGVLVCDGDYDQVGVKVCPDDNGRAVVVWMDYRNGFDWDIYGNKVGADGVVMGPLSGLPICTAPGSQGNPQLIPDGTGGGIVVWWDERDGLRRIFAQRIDGEGVARWAENGIAVCDSMTWQDDPYLVSDGAGGAIVAWSENRAGTGDIYAQRIDADGNLLWAEDGVPVCSLESEQYNVRLVRDGAGGAVIAWSDTRSYESDIYAQRVDGNGDLLWAADGVPVCAASGYQSDMRMIAAAAGGAYLIWSDNRDVGNDLYAQWIDQDGLPVWTADGIAVCPSYWGKYASALAEDGSGGIFVAWYDERDGWKYPIYAQRVDAWGAPVWSQCGIVAIPCYTGSSEIRMMSDGAGGAILAADVYFDESSTADIYAQRLDGDGNTLWGIQGAVVSGASSDQYSPDIATDGAGGAFIVWEDYRGDMGYSDVYGQRMGASGLWGDAAPKIVSCLDVPNDQGGWVRVRTRASAHDRMGGILGYNVWRMIEDGGGGPMAALGDALPRLLDPSKAVGVRLDAAQAAALGLPEGEWESVGFWFATRDTVYNIAVPTKDDSTEAGTPWETFIVTAHAAAPGVFAASEPATGYSIDNLAPGVTPQFAGDEVASPPGLRLSWASNPASDLWKYDVHRGGDAGFVPDASNRIASTEGTEYHDGEWIKSYMYFYKLVAVDRHGNPSPAALLRPEDINVGALLQSYAATLAGSFVEIAWTVSEAGADARFTVLRAEGGAAFAELAAAAIAREGLSFVCTDRGVEPGTTYRYRVDVSDASGRRTLFETQGIETPSMPLALRQNHPNPFNPSTTIEYYLPAACAVTLEIYDSSGKLVARLLDGETQARGTHSVEWRGTDGNGRAASSGVYFYRLRAGRETLSRKMVLLR